MADGGALWNRRHVSCDLSVCESNVFKKDIDEDLVIEVVNKMSILKRNFAKPSLWSQVSILQAVIYKHHNQHRKEKYFQGLKRVHKFLRRLQELEIHKLITQVMQQFPRVDSRVERHQGHPCFPSVQIISHLLLSLMGCAKLIIQTIAMCEETVKNILGQLALGFFITFHVVSVASLSRFWILLKDLLQDTLDCYKVTRPWIKLLGDSNEAKRDNSSVPECLPECLETWLAPDSTFTRNSSRKIATPVTLKNSTLLEKLFASTPGPCTPDRSPQREKVRAATTHCSLLQDESLRSIAANTDLGEPVFSLGGSFIAEDKMQQRKNETDKSPMRLELFTRLDEKKLSDKDYSNSTNTWRSLESYHSKRLRKDARKTGETGEVASKIPSRNDARRSRSGARRSKNDARRSRSEGTFRDLCPRSRTVSSPAMRIRERCRKLLFQRQCGTKSGSLRSGITNDERRRVKGSEKTVKPKEFGNRDRTLNSNNVATVHEKLRKESGVRSRWKDRDSDTEDEGASSQRKRAIEDTKKSKKVQLMDLGERDEQDSQILRGSDRVQRLLQLQMSKSPQTTPGKAYSTYSAAEFKNTGGLITAQRQRTKEDDIDDIFSVLKL